MRTVLLSDLHIGSRNNHDLLRREDIQNLLFAQINPGDRVVLLGDVLELRHGYVSEIIAQSELFFRGLGEAVAGGEVVYLCGNHDHRLIGSWIAQRLRKTETPIELEQTLPLEQLVPFEPIREWLGNSQLTVKYPGIWVTPKIYATHGHYLDLHITLPTVERVAVGALGRFLGQQHSEGLGPYHYERVQARLYSFLGSLVDRLGGEATARGASTSPKAWERLTAEDESSWFTDQGFPAAVQMLNRVGIGPLNTELSGDELRRAGLAAMSVVVDRLAVDADYVVFGHTHRPGPLTTDDHSEWQLSDNSQLVNTGSWVCDLKFLAEDSSQSPYWPGTYVVVEEDGRLKQHSLLSQLTRADLQQL